MKHLFRIVTVTTIAALSLGCVSAFAEVKYDKSAIQSASTKITANDSDRNKPGRKGGKDGANKPELTEEEKAARAEKMKAKLAEKLEAGEITQEEYDAGLARIESGDIKPGHKGSKDGVNKPELTEEEKAARAEKMKAKLAEKLEAGEITQEEYDAELARIESGDIKPGRKGGKDHSGQKPRNRMNNESTAE